MKPMLATRYYPSQTKFPCFVQPKYDGVAASFMREKTERFTSHREAVRNMMFLRLRLGERNIAVCFLWMGDIQPPGIDLPTDMLCRQVPFCYD